MKLKVSIASVLLFSFCAGAALAQNGTKRNGRPRETPATPSPASQTTEKTAGTARYTWEFTQREFVINHILIEHDSSGRCQITFEHRSEEIPIVEPIELSSAALARINALWSNLQFLDSDEDYQSSKNFAHLGTYRLGIEDGKRKRTAEFEQERVEPGGRIPPRGRPGDSGLRPETRARSAAAECALLLERDGIVAGPQRVV